MGEKHHGFILYPLSETGPLGQLHASRRVGDRSMQAPIPALGAGIFKKLPTGSGIRFAGVGGDGVDAGIRRQLSLEMRKVDDFSGSGPAIRRIGGAPGLRDGVCRQGTVDGIRHGRIIVHLLSQSG